VNVHPQFPVLVVYPNPSTFMS